MKALCHFLTVSAATCALLIGASRLNRVPAPVVTARHDGIFSEHQRTRVIQYFETFAVPGSPPPVAESGATVRRTLGPAARARLAEVPHELVRVLPAPRGQVSYAISGHDLVALDENFRVLDAVRLPAVPPRQPAPEGGLRLVSHTTE